MQQEVGKQKRRKFPLPSPPWHSCPSLYLTNLIVITWELTCLLVDGVTLGNSIRGLQTSVLSPLHDLGQVVRVLDPLFLPLRNVIAMLHNMSIQRWGGYGCLALVTVRCCRSVKCCLWNPSLEHDCVCGIFGWSNEGVNNCQGSIELQRTGLSSSHFQLLRPCCHWPCTLSIHNLLETQKSQPDDLVLRGLKDVSGTVCPQKAGDPRALKWAGEWSLTWSGCTAWVIGVPGLGCHNLWPHKHEGT